MQDIQHYRSIVLREGYQDRVNAVASAVLDRARVAPVDRAGLEHLIAVQAESQRVIDWYSSAQARREFKRDVLAALKNQISLKRLTSGTSQRAQAKRALKHLVEYLARELVDELGNVFPDGDPHDAMLRMVDEVTRSDRVGGSAISTRLFGDPNTNLDSIKSALDPESWGSIRDWLEDVVWPQVVAQFTRDQGQAPYRYLADLWDSMARDHEADARAWAKRTRGDPEQYLAQRGFGGHNPYR